jgi:choline dehydrogenase-like flavoprotein
MAPISQAARGSPCSGRALWWPDEQATCGSGTTSRCGAGRCPSPPLRRVRRRRWWLGHRGPYRAPGTIFDWYAAAGQRTNHWAGSRSVQPRLSSRSLGGLGDDWPISYDDLKPWYDEVDRLIGIFGSVEGLPNEPDGIFLPPPAPRCWEKTIQSAAVRLGRTIIPSRLSILTRPHNGRPACHYCGQCNRGCRANANFSAPGVLLRPALATGRLTIIPNAMAREITVLPDGRARGVAYIDKTTGGEVEIRRLVVVGGKRLLSRRGSSSTRNRRATPTASPTARRGGVPHRHGRLRDGRSPSLMNGKTHNLRRGGGAHLYFPWVLDNRKLDFPRGYHIEIWGGRGMPGAGAMGGMQHRPIGGGYGVALKQAARSYYGAFVGFDGRGEQIPTAHCYCEIDPAVVDQWGIPVLRFHWKWADWEINQAKHMRKTFAELIDAMGGTTADPVDLPDGGIATGGRIIHELGTVRMGNDPATSALNRYCQPTSPERLRHRRRALRLAGGQEPTGPSSRSRCAPATTSRRR